MKKIIALALLAAFVLPGMASPVFAAVEKTEQGIVDVGNKICPIMGGKVDGKTFVVYKGKRYSFCCPGCDQTFLTNPEMYIAKIKAAEKDLKTI